MRDEYKIKGTTAHIEIDVEKEVADTIHVMEKYSGLSFSELANTALKRFITHHSDFLPHDASKAQKK